jgi:circadian clock protein KaiC
MPPTESAASGLPRLASGIPGLDIVLKGGFPRAGITIVQGTPGAGKTIFGNQLCHHHVAHGGKAIYVTLLAESHARMQLHMSQLGFFDPRVIPERLYLISAFRVLEEDGLRGLQDLLRREVQRFGASVLVLDGLVAAEESASTAREFKKFIHELQMHASMSNCTMFLLTGVSNRPVAPEHTMVDGVIELRSDGVGRGSERTMTVHKMRGVGMIGGRHGMRISSDGIGVFPRIESRVASHAGLDAAGNLISTGLTELDRMVGGGIALGSTTLLVGPSGVGKTTLGLQFLSQCTPEERGVLLGLYETPDSLRIKARALNLPLADLLDSGAVEMLWYPTTEGLVDEICGQLIETARRRRARRIFVDGIGGLESLMQDQTRLSRVLSALSIHFQEMKTAAVFSAESKASGGVHDLPLEGVSLQGVSAVAQNIVMMRYMELRNRLHRAISVLKGRNAPLDPQMRRYQMTGRGVDIDPDPLSVEKLIDDARSDPHSGTGR